MTYRDERVCLLVCLSASISPELHVRSSQKFRACYTMAVARPSSGGVAICYVVPDMDDVTRTASDVARRSCDAGIDRSSHA